MKLLKFYLKYFFFRSTWKLKNIEFVIRSHGFRIYRFRLEDKNAPITELIESLGAIDYAKHHDCFTATNPIIKGVFIKSGLSDDDRLELLFHEEAHIWYNHPNITGFINETTAQQEKVANHFLSRLRILKTVTTLVLLSALAVGIYFFPMLLTKTEVYTLSMELEIENQPSVDPGVPAEASSEPVWITESGDCYHRQDCHQIQSSNTLSISKNLAEQFGKDPCQSCLP